MKTAFFFSVYMVFCFMWIGALIAGNGWLISLDMGVVITLGAMILYSWVLFFIGYLVIIYLTDRV